MVEKPTKKKDPNKMTSRTHLTPDQIEKIALEVNRVKNVAELASESEVPSTAIYSAMQWLKKHGVQIPQGKAGANYSIALGRLRKKGLVTK